MSLPRWTTTVTVRRPDETGTVDPWDSAAAAFTDVAAGVHAVFYRPAGSKKADGWAGRSEAAMQFACDVTDVNTDDLLVDEMTSEVWQVVIAERRLPPAGKATGATDLDHITGRVHRFSGEINAG